MEQVSVYTVGQHERNTAKTCPQKAHAVYKSPSIYTVHIYSHVCSYICSTIAVVTRVPTNCTCIPMCECNPVLVEYALCK